MKAELKNLYSLELEGSLSEFKPDNIFNFCTWIRVYIGAKDSPGSDAFDIKVCTPEWLKTEAVNQGAVWGGYMLIINEYGYDLIKNSIELKVNQVVGENWNSIAIKLGCLGFWEFAGYEQ